MKISTEHYETLRAAIDAVMAENPDAHQKYADAGLSDKRFRWDLLWSAQLTGKLPRYWVTDTLYPAGLSDSHIDTALRRIVA